MKRFKWGFIALTITLTILGIESIKDNNFEKILKNHKVSQGKTEANEERNIENNNVDSERDNKEGEKVYSTERYKDEIEKLSKSNSKLNIKPIMVEY